MDDTTRKTIFCTSCGAEFDINLPECPYCGTMNYIGAEAQYLEKLEDVREDLDDLQEVPMEEMKKEIKSQMGFVKKIIFRVGGVILAIVLLVAACNYREQKREEKIAAKTMQWLDDNEEIFDKLYHEKKYEEMLEKYQAVADYDEDIALYQWKYFEFMLTYEEIREAEELLQMEQSGEKILDYEYISILNIEWILYSQEGYTWNELTTEQKEIINGMKDPLLLDFQSRWGITDSQIQELINLTNANYGTLPYEKRKEIVEEWMKKQEG